MVTRQDFLCYIVKMYFEMSLFDVVYEVQKDLQDVSTGTDI